MKISGIGLRFRFVAGICSRAVISKVDALSLMELLSGLSHTPVIRRISFFLGTMTMTRSAVIETFYLDFAVIRTTSLLVTFEKWFPERWRRRQNK